MNSLATTRVTGSDADPLEALRARGERFLEEISAEYHAAHAGLKKGAALQPIYEKHKAAYDDEAFASALALFKANAPNGQKADAPAKGGASGAAAEAAPNDVSATFRSARLLLDWLVESRAGRELAPLEEREIAWESDAIIQLPDGSGEPYQRVAITIANTTDTHERHAIDSARAGLVAAELAPIRRERLQREHEVVAALGIAPTYNATFEALSGVSLRALRDECEAFLRDTQAMWDDLMPAYLKSRLGMRPADATRADVVALMRAPEYDAFFPASSMEREVRRQVTEMGISADAEGRVRYDTGEREGKRSRAFCAPVHIPDEVHLVLRPHGGQGDWTTLMHELGHALHFGYMAPALPFEFRWLGDNSVTEGYAMLFDHRLKDRGWVERYTGIGRKEMTDYLRATGFEELHFVRRYCAKLIYEVELHAGTTGWDALPDLFVETLTSATGFRYHAADAFVDVDPRFYAARYLRAWQLQAVLDETLRERFNEDWWRNPHAGPWIVDELFSQGQRELADEQAKRVASRGLSFAPVIADIERMVN
ncbi:MAG TPA: hypothetical protein VFM71_06025 [Gemmatimonadaceae bacterium]|nr:hypothetical protein [Gemmatimonadaceae bacterium]